MYRSARYDFLCDARLFFADEPVFLFPALLVAAPSNSSDDAASRSTCFMVHCFGALSGRHLKNPVPWRKRPPVKWSYFTSTTSFVLSGTHSPVRSVLHLLGPPGACPEKPGAPFSASSFGVSSFRSTTENAEQKPTWLSNPCSS